MVVEVVEDCDISQFDMDICITFRAKVLHPETKNEAELKYECPEVKEKCLYGEHYYECETDWLITTMSEMATTTLGEYLTRHLNDLYPEIAFDEVEIMGYNFRK